MDVIEFSLAVEQELVDNLHQPVGSALGEGGYEDVARTWNIAGEGILLCQASYLALPHGGEEPFGASQFFQCPNQRGGDAVHEGGEATTGRE